MDDTAEFSTLEAILEDIENDRPIMMTALLLESGIQKFLGTFFESTFSFADETRSRLQDQMQPYGHYLRYAQHNVE